MILVDLKFVVCLDLVSLLYGKALWETKTRWLPSLVVFLHFSIADQAKSQHTLNPDAQEFRPSFGKSERFQTNGSNRYALYFILLCTMNVKYLKNLRYCMLPMLWFFELRRNYCQNIIERYDAIISDVVL